MDQRRFSEAVALLQQAVALAPDHADSWFNLGYALRQARAYPQALDAYAEALRRHVSEPEAVRVNRAAILSEYLEQTGEAEHELRTAIALNPAFLPAWLNLGGLMEDVGNAEAAADAYRQALRIAPGNGRARARLAAIRVHAGEESAAIVDLRERLRLGADSGEDTAELLFALGNALDADGQYPEAFRTIAKANAINSALRPVSERYNRLQQERLVDSLIEAFPTRPVTTETNDGATMIFVCGLFRSGSTVIEQLLGRHPKIQVGGELELVPALVHDHLLPYPAKLRNIREDQLQLLRGRYLDSIRSNFPDAIYVSDKRPDNFLHIGLIKTLFPRARLVHTVRDALDNLLSIYFLNFADTIRYSDRLEDIVHYIGQYRRLMAHWERIFGDDIVTVDYDRLVHDPDAMMSETFERLGLPAIAPDTGQPSPPTIIRTPSNWRARGAVHTRSSGRWQNYATEIEAARIALGETDR